MCADAFMFIWTKRQLAGEMLRLVDEGRHGEAVAITHAHNQLQWSPSLGQPLPPEGYRDLFETLEARVFAESPLFADVLKGGPIDLARRDAAEVLNGDQALEIVASADPRVFQPHEVDASPGHPGELRINPLYGVEEAGGGLRLTLAFPSADYADEFGACREYLPESVTLDAESVAALGSGRLPAGLADLVRRRVILDLPRRYY
jgi:hypothetical protein